MNTKTDKQLANNAVDIAELSDQLKEWLDGWTRDAIAGQNPTLQFIRGQLVSLEARAGAQAKFIERKGKQGD